MSLAWLSPAVLWGLALVGAPIAIHLLARHQARTVPFPSLRFLGPTHLAALRRRRIEDVALLMCRLAIIALAVAALAGAAPASGFLVMALGVAEGLLLAALAASFAGAALAGSCAFAQIGRAHV